MEYGLTLKAILDNSIESIVFVSPEHKLIAFNKTIQEVQSRYFGRQLQVGDDYRDFVTPTSREVYLDSFAKAINGETVIVQNETKTDTFSIWFEYMINPVYNPQGELLGVTFMAKNIDKQKKAEIELQSLSQTVNAIFDNTSENILLIAPDFKLLRFNKTIFESFRKNKNKTICIGYDFRDLLADDEREILLGMFHKALQGEASSEEIKSINHKGEPFWFQARMKPAYKQNGELFGVALFTINTTEKKLIQFSLKDNEDKLKEIAWNQSHIIRTPVTQIMGIANMIKDYPNLDNAERMQWIDQLLKTTEELDSVIKNIVSLTETKQ